MLWVQNMTDHPQCLAVEQSLPDEFDVYLKDTILEVHATVYIVGWAFHAFRYFDLSSKFGVQELDKFLHDMKNRPVQVTNHD